jgi:hypothetical protein
MSSVLVHPPEAAPRSRRLALIAAGVVVSLALLAGMFALVRRPDFVPRVTIVNRTGTPLQVDVAAGPHDAILPLGVVESHSTDSFLDVVDQGDVWYVHVTDTGNGARTLHFTRDQLRRANWHVTIPASFSPKKGATTPAR